MCHIYQLKILKTGDFQQDFHEIWQKQEIFREIFAKMGGVVAAASKGLHVITSSPAGSRRRRRAAAAVSGPQSTRRGRRWGRGMERAS